MLSIAAGGALGAVSRYIDSRTVSSAAYRSTAGIFPWGTFAVNMTGCFLIGFLSILSEKTEMDPRLRSFLGVGFIGAFTTFSTFSLETLNLMRDGEFMLAFTNAGLSLVLGLAACLAGMTAGRALVR